MLSSGISWALNYNIDLYMRKIECIFCLLGLALALPGCQDDDETAVILKPDGITYGTVTDRGGNVYRTLTIGNQTWLAENFRYRPDEATAADQVTYGESFGGNDRDILEGTDMSSYRNFCRNYSGQRFLLYLREQLLAAGEAGRLNTGSSHGVEWILTQVGNYTIPNILSNNEHDDIREELMNIWNDAVNYYFKFDMDYLARFGYLYSYEGALKAVREGAPEGFHLPTDAEWMMLERCLGMDVEELEGLENWRGDAGELLKAGEQGIGFDALYGGAAIYALSTAYNSRYVNKNEEAYFWSSDQIAVSDSLSDGIVRSVSLYHSGIRRMTSRLISTEGTVRPSYSVRLVKCPL